MKSHDSFKQSHESREQHLGDGKGHKLIVESRQDDVVSRTSQGSRQKGDAFRRMLSQKTSITAQVDTLFLAVKSLDTNKVISIL